MAPFAFCGASIEIQSFCGQVGFQHIRPYHNTKVDVDAATPPKVTASLASGYARMLSAVQTALMIVPKGHSPRGALALCILDQGAKHQHYTMTRGS